MTRALFGAFAALAAFTALALLAGCAEEPGTAEFCADQPVVTYDNFGAGFLVENCQSCHASTAPDRQEAPEDVTFDTLEDVQEQIPTILIFSTGEDPEMPPEGGVDEDERHLLEVWLRCWEA